MHYGLILETVLRKCVSASLCLRRDTSCNSGFRALNLSAPNSLCYKKKVLMTVREEAGQMASSSGTAPPYGRAENAAHKMPSMEETIAVTKHGLILTSVTTVNH